ncbi:MAG: hypothetical protein AB7J32_10550 [Pseudonocardia sp.]
MRIMRRAALVTALGLVPAVLAGCGPSEADGSGVQTIFHAYHAALLARDFPTACALNAPETSAELVRNVNAQGGAAGSCEEALATVYGGPGATVADEVSRTARVDGVAVEGDTARLTWTFAANGSTRTVDTGLRRIDGRWRLLDAGA